MKARKIYVGLLILFILFTILPTDIGQVNATKKVVKVKKIKLNKKTYTLKKGSKLKLKATLTPAKTTEKELIWSSSKKKIATVSSKGVVKAKKNGKATITVKVKGTNKKAACKITVGTPVKKVNLNVSQKTLYINDTINIQATISPKTATTKSVYWESSNTKVATVTSNGKVKTISPGTAIISATTKDGTGQKASCVITVKEKNPISVEVSGIKAEQDYVRMTLNDEPVQLQVSTIPYNATNQEFKWYSYNSDVATVNSTGVVTPVGEGSTMIVVSASLDGNTYYTYITVVVTKKDWEGLYIKSITSDDGFMTENEISESGGYPFHEGLLVITGVRASLEECKNNIVFTFGPEVVSYEWSYYEYPEGDIYIGKSPILVIYGADGKNRTYSVTYWTSPYGSDYTEFFGDFGVKSIATIDDSITNGEYISWSFTGDSISGTKEKFSDMKDNLVFEFLGEVERYEWGDITIVNGDEQIPLTIYRADGFFRTYYILYHWDKDAYYEELKVESVSCPGFLTGYEIWESGISLYGGRTRFDKFKEQLIMTFGDDVVDYYLASSELENVDAVLVLKRIDGETRSYNIYYYGFENYEVKSIDYHESNNIYGYNMGEDITFYVYSGTIAEFETEKDNIVIDVSDDTVFWEWCYDEENAEWNLILEREDGFKRIYTIYYEIE